MLAESLGDYVVEDFPVPGVKLEEHESDTMLITSCGEKATFGESRMGSDDFGLVWPEHRFRCGSFFPIPSPALLH